MNVIGYKRVSTDNQCKEEKFGLEVQQKQIEAYCAEHDMTVVRWISDEGESGAKTRPGFDEIVYGDVTNPPYEAVIVAKSDRVARDIEVYYYYKMLLRKKNVALISISEDFGKFGVFADMLESFTLCVAKMERENINKRTSAGRGVKSARGGYSGGRPPFGYKAVGHALQIDPEEADTVRNIFRLKEGEGRSYQEVIAWLDANGRTNRSGTKFSISTLQVILGNKPLYQGMYKYGKEMDWVQGVHDPILPTKTDS